VKFIIDAQLPVKLAVALTAAGHDAVHTLNLPDKNRSRDSYIVRLADSEGRVVISKDADFVTSHIVHSWVSIAPIADFYREHATLDVATTRFGQS